MVDFATRYANMDADQNLIDSRFWRDEHLPVIYITPANRQDIATYNITYGDMHEATCRWFVDKLGFDLKTIKLSDDSKNHPMNVVVKMEFVGSGLAMAKLQGLLE